MRIKYRFWIMIVGLTLLVAMGVAAQNSAVTCPTLVQESFTATEFLCESVPDGQACLGNGIVSTTLLDDAVVQLAEPGDLVVLANLQRLQAQTINTDTQAFTSILAKLNASTPNGDPQVVDMLIFGDSVISNAVEDGAIPAAVGGILSGTVEAAGGVIIRQDATVDANNIWQLLNGEPIQAIGRSSDNQWVRVLIPSPNGGAGWVFGQFVSIDGGRELLPFQTNTSPVPDSSGSSTQEVTLKSMQGFRFESLLTDPSCVETPDSGIMLQSSSLDTRALVEVNGVELRIRGTAYITAQLGDKMTIHNLEGDIAVIVGEDRVDMTVGTTSEVAVDASLAPTGAPTEATAYSQELADLLVFLPIRLLSRNFEITLSDPSEVANTSTDTSEPTNQTAPPPPVATEVPPDEPIVSEECPTLVQESYTATEQVCDMSNPNTACIGTTGADMVTATARSGVEDFTFANTSETVATTDIATLTTHVFDDPDNIWTSIVMTLDAKTTNDGIAQATIQIFGEVELENAVPETLQAGASTDTNGVPAVVEAPGGIIVRVEPRVDASTAGQLQDGDAVTAFAVSEDQQWIQVQNDAGVLGWVFVQFVSVEGGIGAVPIGTVITPTTDTETETEPPPATTTDTSSGDTNGSVTAPGGIIVRAQPRVDTETVGQLQDGDPVFVLGRSVDQQWVQIESATGVSGWVFVQFITVDGGAESLPVIDPNATNSDSGAAAPPPPPVTNQQAAPPPPATSTGGESEFDSMQAFNFVSNGIATNCTNTTSSGIMIQSPDIDEHLRFLINGVEFELKGTTYLRATRDDNFIVIGLEGETIVTSRQSTHVVLAGQQSLIAMTNDLMPNSTPSEPEDYTNANGNRFLFLPIRLMPRNFELVIPPVVTEEPVVDDTDDSEDESESTDESTGSDLVNIGGTLVNFNANCEISAGDSARNFRADAGGGFDVINVLQSAQTIKAITQKRGTDGVYWYETAQGWIRSDAGIPSDDCQYLPLYGVIYDTTSSGGEISAVAPLAPLPPAQPTATPIPPIVSDGFGNVCGSGGLVISTEVESSGQNFVEFGGVWTGQAGQSVTFTAEVPYFRQELQNILTFVNEDGSAWLGSTNNPTFTIIFDSTRRFRVRVGALLGDYITLRVNC